MQDLIYHDQYAPITSEIGFLECDAKTAADAFQEWQLPIQSRRGVHLNRRDITGDMPAAIQALLPLTSVEARRYLFLPTLSTWTAFLDSGWRGTDVFSTISHLATMVGRRGIRAVSTPHTIRKTPAGERGRFGATMLEVYSPDSSSCSFLNIQRSIGCINDDGRWRFDANGEPLEFERLECYSSRHIRNRFTPEMLDEYLSHFGIRFFSTNFYKVSQPAYLIYKEGLSAPGMKEYSLLDARELY